MVDYDRFYGTIYMVRQDQSPVTLVTLGKENPSMFHILGAIAGVILGLGLGAKIVEGRKTSPLNGLVVLVLAIVGIVLGWWVGGIVGAIVGFAFKLALILGIIVICVGVAAFAWKTVDGSGSPNKVK